MAAPSSSDKIIQVWCDKCGGSGKCLVLAPACDMCRDKGCIDDISGLPAAYKPPVDKDGKPILNPDGSPPLYRSWNGPLPQMACPSNCEAAKKWLAEPLACPCRYRRGFTRGWCGVAGGGVPGCDH